jgi:glutamate:GABA antiporter
LIFFFIVGAIIFLFPSALVSAQLAVLSPKQGGIYYWLRQVFGARVAALGVWLQWVNTMVWFPSMLMFIGGTFAYLINPQLVNDRNYLLSVILLVFWAVTFINFFGLKASARFASVCAVVGLLIPFILIIVLGAIWVLSGRPLQLHFTVHSLMPHLANQSNWVSLTGVITAFLGMELATVHVGQTENAAEIFPRALKISVFLILLIMIFGALTIACVLPASQISLVSGVMQSFENFLRAYHMHWALPIITIMILIGSLGGMVNWLISPAKGLLQAAEDGFLPRGLTYQNKHGVASRVLLIQGLVVTLICGSMLLMPTVNGAYWLLTDLSTQLYLFMYVLMFCAAVAFSYKQQFADSLYALSRGRIGLRLVSGLGLLGCTISIIVGFIPPTQIAVGGAMHFELLFSIGLLIMILPVLLLWRYQTVNKNNNN